MTPRPAPADDGADDSNQIAPTADGKDGSTNEHAAGTANCSQVMPSAHEPGYREDLDTCITEMAASAPPLTTRQRDKLAMIFRHRPSTLVPTAA